jgi:hypothetical protein
MQDGSLRRQFPLMRNWLNRSGRGGFAAPTTSRTTGCSPARTAKANSRTGRVRSTGLLRKQQLIPFEE